MTALDDAVAQLRDALAEHDRRVRQADLTRAARAELDDDRRLLEFLEYEQDRHRRALAAFDGDRTARRSLGFVWRPDRARRQAEDALAETTAQLAGQQKVLDARRLEIERRGTADVDDSASRVEALRSMVRSLLREADPGRYISLVEHEQAREAARIHLAALDPAEEACADAFGRVRGAWHRIDQFRDYYRMRGAGKAQIALVLDEVLVQVDMLRPVLDRLRAELRVVERRLTDLADMGSLSEEVYFERWFGEYHLELQVLLRLEHFEVQLEDCAAALTAVRDQLVRRRATTCADLEREEQAIRAVLGI